MRVWPCLWIIVFTSSALANSGEHLNAGQKWFEVARYQKAIEEFEQAYQENAGVICLYHIAQSYERLATLPTKTPSEVSENKQQALELYKTFISKGPPSQPALEVAHSRIESLPQEIKELEAQRAEQEASIKLLNENIKQLLAEIRALRELLPRRERGATSAGLMR